MRDIYLYYMKHIFFLMLLSATAAAQEVKYTNGNGGWNADSLGNHRAVVTFNGSGKVARVIIPWRRRDTLPEQKRIIVQDAQTKQAIPHVAIHRLTREQGDLCFEPVSGKGNYYVYYLPYKNEGRANYPKGVYLPPLPSVNDAWSQSFRPGQVKQNAFVKEFQSIDTVNTFYPMEVIATAAETWQLLLKHAGAAYLVFPEDRQYPIKMTNDLPGRWIQRGPRQSFAGQANSGAYYAFQLGLYAVKPLEQVQLSFSDLKAPGGRVIPASALDCINTGGTGYDGRPFINIITVPAGKVQALWCGVDVPADAVPGVYKGTVTIRPAGLPASTIQLTITVTPKLTVNNGADEPWKQTRLKWLNSTLAQQNEVIAPYTPLELKDSAISLLGRRVRLGRDGFPAQLQTFFTPEMTALTTEPRDLLTEPLHFHFVTPDGKNLPWRSNGYAITAQEPGKISWQALNTAPGLQMKVNASLEFDGFMDYTVQVVAVQDMQLKDITMHIPLQPDAARYMMGLNRKGGYRPEKIDWKWDVARKNQDGAWIGDVNAGLQFSLRDEHYVRPLNTNFYLQKPLLLPVSWANNNKGGITIEPKGKSILVNSYSGERALHKGDTLYFNFHLILTPFHQLNTDFQWATRFYHRYNNLDSIKATGATVVNIHHATPINPWINYPFIEHAKMKAYIDEAHRKGLKVKIYNTVRELSNRAYETFPLRSLGHEVYTPGPGGGFSWLQEHLGGDYIPAWFVPEIKDAAIINSGMNRWHNYYVEGMNWLVQHTGIDGIYLDDVAFDRITMKRIKRVLTQNGHPGIVDLHSANQYNERDGFINSAMLYMEHFPYLNRLWFGEYFDYERNSPDFFLTEVSGIPFGLMGEMLQDGGNAWRGMVYGMTSRMPWSEEADPRPIWKVWDDFGMQGSQMIGYWAPACPVKTNNPEVLATVYKKTGAALISIASWAKEDVTVKLDINWQALGIDPGKATITAPDIRNFQTGQTFTKDSAIPVSRNKGWLLIIK